LLNRNPNKRLGAGPTDAEEIKKHPWFEGVNWDDVYNRKLSVPKPSIKKIATAGLPASTIEQKTSDSANSKIDGWSFVAFDK